MYQNRIESKKWRDWNRIFAKDFTIYTELYSKYFKRYYKGKMTKRFARLSKKIEETENNFNADEYLKLFKSYKN